MRSRLFLASVIGFIAYIINILIGLFSFQSLVDIFKHGIISFVIIFILSYILIYVIDITKRASDRQEKKKEHNKAGEQTSAEKNNESSSKDNNSNNSEDDFSPMEPPVVEYEEKNEL